MARPSRRSERVFPLVDRTPAALRTGPSRVPGALASGVPQFGAAGSGTWEAGNLENLRALGLRRSAGFQSFSGFQIFTASGPYPRRYPRVGLAAPGFWRYFLGLDISRRPVGFNGSSAHHFRRFGTLDHQRKRRGIPAAVPSAVAGHSDEAAREPRCRQCAGIEPYSSHRLAAPVSGLTPDETL